MHDTANNPYPNVPFPAGAVTAYDWDPPRVTGLPDTTRYWVGSERMIHIDHRTQVTIDGVQHADGRVERYIVVGQARPDGTTMIIDDPITPQQARAWGAALIAAADEIESAIEIEWNRQS
jgi:hypothetical protein